MLPARGRVAVTVSSIALLALVLGACAGPDETGTMAQRVSAWASSTGFTGEIGTISADIDRVARVAAHGSPGAIRADCAVLSSDTAEAHQNLPTPDQGLTETLVRAYGEASNAAEDCYAGAGGAPGDMARFSAEREAFFRSSIQAQAEVDTLEHGGAVSGSGGS